MKTKRLGFMIALAVFLVIAGFATTGEARVSVGIGINIPGYTFAAPPPVVVIPGSYVYFAPEADVDILFYHGYWYRPYEGRWFRARGYNGPWGYVEPSVVPRAVIGVPPDFRHVYGDRPRIGYGDFHRNWRGWERNRHWDRDEGWRAGRGNERHEEMEHRERDHDMRDHGERGDRY